MGADCKSVGLAFEGSNPSPATNAPGLHRPGAFARDGCRVSDRAVSTAVVRMGGAGRIARAPVGHTGTEMTTPE